VPGAALELYEARPLILLAALSRMAVGELPGWSLRAGGDGQPWRVDEHPVARSSCPTPEAGVGIDRGVVG
jgi:hypothetical protein